MNRFDRSCIRSFFTLPPHLQSVEGTTTLTAHNQPFKESLRDANSIIQKDKKFYIIWFDEPDTLTAEDRIDLSFRDFSLFDIPPVVLIRKSAHSTN